VDWMPRGRHRTEDSHQTTGATNGTLIKPKPRTAVPSAARHGRLPRTTSRAWVETIAVLRELNDRRIPSSTESSSLAKSSAR
jgi:hypothetical protein